MRRLLSFSIGIALLGGGLYFLYLELFESSVIQGKFVVAGGFTAFIGAVFLWDTIFDPPTTNGTKHDA